jgi:hypothetical protein
MVPYGVELAPAELGPLGIGFLIPYLPPVEVIAETAGQVRVVEFFEGDPDQNLVAAGHGGGALVSWQVGSAGEGRAAEAGRMRPGCRPGRGGGWPCAREGAPGRAAARHARSRRRAGGRGRRDRDHRAGGRSHSRGRRRRPGRHPLPRLPRMQHPPCICRSTASGRGRRHRHQRRFRRQRPLAGRGEGTRRLGCPGRRAGNRSTMPPTREAEDPLAIEESLRRLTALAESAS